MSQTRFLNATDTLLTFPTDVSKFSQEERLRLACAAIDQSGISDNGKPKLSIRQAALKFNVPKSTLGARRLGIQTRSEAHVAQKNLTPAQEDFLVNWLKTLGRRAIPLSQPMLAAHVSKICGKSIGKNWTKRFMSRHPELRIKWTTSLERCRAQQLNPTVVGKYFKMIQGLIDEFHIEPCNIYNMDEKGVQLGISDRIAAIIDRDQQSVYQIEDGNQDIITIIETVCANGSTLHPLVIFQGKRRNLEWGRDNPCNARYGYFHP